jgi:hypothetical protein
MTEAITDYPFKCWTTFFMAFTELLNTEDIEDIEENYPKYIKILRKYNNSQIIYKIFTKYNLDANEGLYKYIEALCYEGVRYSLDYYDYNIIDFFLKKGAEFPTGLLFDSEPELFENDIREECKNYEIRAQILDDFGEELKIDVSSYANWKNIEDEHIDDQDIDEENLDDYEYTNKIRFKHFKFISEYLQNIE